MMFTTDSVVVTPTVASQQQANIFLLGSVIASIQLVVVVDAVRGTKHGEKLLPTMTPTTEVRIRTADRPAFNGSIQRGGRGASCC